MEQPGQDREISEERMTKTWGKVFDSPTIKALHALSSKGYFDHAEFLVNEGKEANLYLAKDYSGQSLAVKVYKTLVADFKNMRPYIEGDVRFKNVKKTRHGLIKQWAQKEFKNLTLMQKIDARAPYPIAVKENVLVMEFIGEGDIASRRLKETKNFDAGSVYRAVAGNMAKMLYLGELIHADLSEYNILMHGNEPVLIDMGQSVLTNHPKAEEFFFRDVRNMDKFFKSAGIMEPDIVREIRALKQSLL